MSFMLRGEFPARVGGALSDSRPWDNGLPDEGRSFNLGAHSAYSGRLSRRHHGMYVVD